MSRLRKLPSDEGSALLVAIMTVGVCISLAIVGVGLAQSATRGSGVDRQRLLAINAAEAGVDSAYTTIQVGGAAPPCSLSSANVKSGPDIASYATTITYYDVAGATLACDAAGAVVGTPSRALIKSKASTNTLGGGSSHGVRTMEALVNLNPLTDATLNKAIFGNAGLTFSNNMTITGNAGPDADVYTNGSFACKNNESFAGSVYAQGTITLGGSCGIAGNIWAGTGITHDSAWNQNVAGFAKTGAGTITLNQGSGTVTGNLYAAGAINYTGGAGCTSGKCFSNGAPGTPPGQQFPILRGDAATLAKWQAGGSGVAPYTVITDNTCGTIVNKITTDYAKRGYNVLVSTTCPVILGNNSFSAANNLAIFTSGGLTTGNMVISSTVAGTKRDLHFVVPYDAATMPCSTPLMDTDKQFDFTNDIDLFVYSPCNITFKNSSDHVGQIYSGGVVDIQNQFNMQFRPIPVLGIDPSSLPPVSYVPSIIYKRETV